jgi:tRNA 5-methylaminomethyl-2-thiouridine biosynthesis bifunctional protein
VHTTWQHAQSLLRAGIDWNPSGTLEHRVKSRRGAPPVANGTDDWHRDATAAQRTAAALADDAPAVWHPRAAWIRPAALVCAWLNHPAITWRGGVRVARLQRTDTGWQVFDEHGHEAGQAPLLVLAAALGCGPLADGRLALQAVRGQVSWGLQSADHHLPTFPINGNGHLLTQIPTDEGPAWLSGSSYGRGDTATDERAQDHTDNLARLRALVPALAERVAPDFAAGRALGGRTRARSLGHNRHGLARPHLRRAVRAVACRAPARRSPAAASAPGRRPGPGAPTARLTLIRIAAQIARQAAPSLANMHIRIKRT